MENSYGRYTVIFSLNDCDLSLHTLVGHKDSVTQVAWSHDGTMLATGDMSGLIQVWSVSTKEMIWSSEISDLEVCAKLGCSEYLSNIL